MEGSEVPYRVSLLAGHVTVARATRSSGIGVITRSVKQVGGGSSIGEAQGSETGGVVRAGEGEGEGEGVGESRVDDVESLVCTRAH